MPILAEEPSLFPQNLLDEVSPEENGRSWRAVYARSRQEKALARQLLAHEIPFYLPLVAKGQCVRGRRVSSYLPLFSGYLFLYATDEERIGAMTTNRILQVLPVDLFLESPHNPDRFFYGMSCLISFTPHVAHEHPGLPLEGLIKVGGIDKPQIVTQTLVNQ